MTRESGGARMDLYTVLIFFHVLLFAGWFFARIYRYAVRTGLIARYSAESVT